MNISEELRASSLFTVGGNSEGVEVIGYHDLNNYDWVCYIMGSLLDNNFGSSRSYSHINSSLLEKMFNSMDYNIDYECLGYTKSTLPVELALTTTSDIYHKTHKLLTSEHRTVSGDYVEIEKGSALTTPFTGVGTKVPQSITWQKLASAISVCKNPLNTHITLVGDVEAAVEVLGLGLERLRGLILNYLGILPSSNSVTLDMPTPFIWQHSLTTPTMLDIVLSQRIMGSSTTALARQYKATAYLSCLLYNILEMDQGYLGLEPPHEYPSLEWSITSSSSRTIVPYRYPLLVHLLAGIEDYFAMKQKFLEKVDLPSELTRIPKFTKLLQNGGSTSYFSIVSSLGAKDTKDNYLYKIIPKVVKGFCIQLYRVTCKNVITLPSNKLYPRRSEASRAFVEVYKKYDRRCSLADYLNLGEILIVNSVITAVPTLKEILSSVKIDVHEALLSNFQVPSLPVKGAVNPDTFTLMLNYSKYYSKMQEWHNVKVHNEWGIELSVTEQLSKVTLALLDNLESELSTSEKFNYITLKHLQGMYNYWGFDSNSITQQDISSTLLNKVTFDKGCISGLKLGCIVDYHTNFKHNATRLVLETVSKLLQAEVMESYEEARDLVGPEYSKRAAKLCVLEHLREILDSTRV